MGTPRQRRACDADHLAAAAAPLQPHRVPFFDRDANVWKWVPPWAPAGSAPVELGRNWVESGVALHRLRARVRCAHGAPLAIACEDCRAAVAAQTDAGAALEAVA